LTVKWCGLDCGNNERPKNDGLGNYAAETNGGQRLLRSIENGAAAESHEWKHAK